MTGISKRFVNSMADCDSPSAFDAATLWASQAPPPPKLLSDEELKKELDEA